MNKDGITPLHGAAGKGDNEVVELLIAKGADIACRSLPDCHRHRRDFKSIHAGF
jgi:ankyrin repeat protein